MKFPVFQFEHHYENGTVQVFQEVFSDPSEAIKHYISSGWEDPAQELLGQVAILRKLTCTIQSPEHTAYCRGPVSVIITWREKSDRDTGCCYGGLTTQYPVMVILEVEQANAWSEYAEDYGYKQ